MISRRLFLNTLRRPRSYLLKAEGRLDFWFWTRAPVRNLSPDGREGEHRNQTQNYLHGTNRARLQKYGLSVFLYIFLLE